MDVNNTVTKASAAKRRSLGLSRVIRPLVSVTLLIFLIQTVGFSKFIDLLSDADPVWLATGLLIVVLALLVSAYKWQWLLIAQGVHVPFLKLFTSYLVAQFFNNFLPTNIGGDVVRIADIGRYTGKAAEATASVVGERLLAGLALGLTAIIGLTLSYQVSGGFAVTVLAVVAIFSTIISLIASSRARVMLGNSVKLPNAFDFRKKLSGVGSSMAISFSNKGIVAWVILLSFGFHATVILLNYSIFRALGVDVPLVNCFLFIPIIMALQMIPISVNGFGVREGSYVYFFGTIGVDAGPAIAASLLFWLLVTIISLFGGVIFALRR